MHSRFGFVAQGCAWLLIGVAGCGSDESKCADETAQSGGQCAPVRGTGGAPSSGGRSSTGGARISGGSGNHDAGTGGTADSGGVEAGAGGSPEGGPPPEGGPIDSGATDPATPPPESRWLALATATEAYLYDFTKRGDASTRIKVGTGLPKKDSAEFLVPFSPDGHWLLSVDGDDVVVRDVSSDAPGAPTTIGHFAGDRISWSADSKSLATLEDPSGADAGFTVRPRSFRLTVVGPLQTAPAKAPIAEGVTQLSWAPRGNLLHYQTEHGHFVVRVVEGVPGTPREFAAPAGWASWLPDGEHLLVHGADLTLTFVEVGGAAPKATPLPATATSALTSFDGAFIAYALDGVAYYARIGSDGLGTAKPVGDAVTPQLWGIDSRALVTTTSTGLSVVRFDAEGPRTRVELPLSQTDYPWAQHLSRRGTLLIYAEHGRNLFSLNLAHPQDGPLALGKFNLGGGVDLSPDGRTIAYGLEVPGQDPYGPFGIRLQDAITGEFRHTVYAVAPWMSWSPGWTSFALRATTSLPYMDPLRVLLGSVDASRPDISFEGPYREVAFQPSN